MRIKTDLYLSSATRQEIRQAAEAQGLSLSQVVHKAWDIARSVVARMPPGQGPDLERQVEQARRQLCRS